MNNLKYFLIMCISSFFLICNVYAKDNIEYKLNIDDSFKEDINVFLNNNDVSYAYNIYYGNNDVLPSSYEFDLIFEDLESVYSDHSKFYNKDISDISSGLDINLKYDYSFEEFLKHNLINSCFENKDISVSSSLVSVNLSGKFLCYFDKDIDISVVSDYKVVNFNGKNNRNVYKWFINKDNYNDFSLSFTFDRDKKYKSSSITADIFKVIIWIFTVIVLLSIATKLNRY